MELKTQIEEKLNKQIMTPTILLNRLMILEDVSNDFRFYPFYYWLGRLTSPKVLLELGFNYGLMSGCFLMGCKTVEKFIAFQEAKEEYYSPRIGRGNVKRHYKGEIQIHVGYNFEDLNKYDLVLVTEEFTYDKYRSYLDLIWLQLNEGGLLSIEYINKNRATKKAYYDFCRVVNRDPVTISTKYEVGLIKK